MLNIRYMQIILPIFLVHFLTIHKWVYAEYPREKLLLGRVGVADTGWERAGCDVLVVPRAVLGP